MLSSDVYINKTGILAFPEGNKFAIVISREGRISGTFYHHETREPITIKPLTLSRGIHLWQLILRT